MREKTTGFASPAMGYEEKGIDLNHLIIQNPPATFLFRMENQDFTDYGVTNGCILVIDRSVDPYPDALVVIRHEGQFLCRIMQKENRKIYFSGGKEVITPTKNDTEIIGVVTYSIREHNYK